MADYSPGALRDLVEDIGHKAIEVDLYFQPGQTGWDGSASEGFYGSGWEGRLPPVSGPTGTVQLKYYGGGLGISVAVMLPGMKHVGDEQDAAGQPYSVYELDPWNDIYEPWMTRIEEAFRGWDSLPDPTLYDGPIEQMRSAVTELTPQPGSAPTENDPDGDYNTNYVNVELDTTLSTIQTVVGDFVDQDMGLLVSTFLQVYGPTRVRGIMFNQGQTAIVLGMALMGEKKIWEGARKDIMAIAQAAKDAMRPGGAGGDDINWEVVKAFVDLFKGFTPAPVQTAIDTTEGVLDIVGMLTPEKPEGSDSVKLEGYLVSEVASSMEEAIRALDKKVFDSEYELKYKTLDGMLTYMYDNDATQFHIDPDAGLAPDLKNAAGLQIRPESLKQVGYTLVPRIAAYMGRAAQAAQAADNSGMWHREQVGMIVDGPYSKWGDVLAQLDKVTTGSAAELVEAGKTLAIGAGWLQDTDNDAQTELQGLENELGRGQNGWDNSRPDPIPPYVTLPGGKNIPI